MNNATNVLAAFREMTANKAISRDELHDLIKDGILAALAKRYGPNVEAEIEIDENTGAINITVLKEVVAEVEDPSRQTSLEEARWDDPDFEKAIGILNDMQQQGQFMGGLDRYYTATDAEKHTAFGDGKAAMNIEGSWFVSDIGDFFGDKM